MNWDKTNFANRISELSPEFQLLLWSIRVDDQFIEKAKKYLYAENSLTNIQKFKRMSFSMGLTQLFYKKMKGLDRHRIDQKLFSTFSEAYMEILARNIKLSFKLEEVFRLLEKNDLSFIAFKGPVLGLMAYKDIALRSSSDLDIMVSNKDFYRIVEILCNIGFSTIFPAQKKITKYLQRSWRDIHLTKGFYHLDIHQQIAQGPLFFRPNIENLKSCKKIKLNQNEVTSFSPEDTLVIMATNCAKDGFSSLKHFRDIAGIVLNNPELDWQRVFSSAKEKCSLKILKISLRLSRMFCGLKLPENISDQIDSRSVDRSVNSITDYLFLSNFKTDILASYFSFAGSLDNIFCKIKFYLWYLIYPSPQMHPTIFRLPKKLFFVIPFISPFYLFYDYLSRFFTTKMAKKTESRRQKSEHRR